MHVADAMTCIGAAFTLLHGDKSAFATTQAALWQDSHTLGYHTLHLMTSYDLASKLCSLPEWCLKTLPEWSMKKQKL